MVWVTGGTLAGTVGSPEEEDPSSAETRGSRAAPPPARGRRGGWETRRHAAIKIFVNMLKVFGLKYLVKNIYRQRVCLGVDTLPRKRGSSLK